MTAHQRITLMADWWPKACAAQGWNKNDRALRMRVLSEAVKRPLASASDLNNTDDIDAVKAHLGMLADNVAATIETLGQGDALGRARRLRVEIGERLKCLGVYHENPAGYLAEIIRDKFQRGSRYVADRPLTIGDLSADPIHFTRAGQLREIPSQLDQVVMTLARAIQVKRKAAGDSVHAMKKKAGVECDCMQCKPRGQAMVIIPKEEVEKHKEAIPF